MLADGRGARAVTVPGAYGDYEPSWSPDGQWIAFQRVDAETVRIGIVSAEGGTPRFLAWPARAYNPAWSPDGQIAFSSNVDGDMDIYIVSPEGVELSRVRRRGIDRNPAWARR
jgi:TolB protein